MVLLVIRMLFATANNNNSSAPPSSHNSSMDPSETPDSSIILTSNGTIHPLALQTIPNAVASSRAGSQQYAPVGSGAGSGVSSSGATPAAANTVTTTTTTATTDQGSAPPSYRSSISAATIPLSLPSSSRRGSDPSIRQGPSPSGAVTVLIHSPPPPLPARRDSGSEPTTTATDTAGLVTPISASPLYAAATRGNQ